MVPIPQRKNGESLWDYIARAMTDVEFKKAIPNHEARLELVIKESRS